jgi:hypothetical protein
MGGVRKDVFLHDMMAAWKSGHGPYPYDSKHPRVHRFLSVAIGRAWYLGIRAAGARYEIVDEEGWFTAENRPFVGCLWHRWASVAIEITSRIQQKQVWLNLREDKMGPTHELCRSFGVDLALTSNRERKMGSESVAVVADCLAKGSCSTIVMPDGPK